MKPSFEFKGGVTGDDYWLMNELAAERKRGMATEIQKTLNFGMFLRKKMKQGYTVVLEAPPGKRDIEITDDRLEAE